jgi:hypothetical protein
MIAGRYRIKTPSTSIRWRSIRVCQIGKRQERLMTDGRWEFPIVLIISATVFLSVWHFVAPLFG